MTDGQKNIRLGSLGNIDWNKLKPGLKKENLKAELNTIWDKINTTKDTEIDQSELDAFKADFAKALEDNVISAEEAKAYLESKGLNDIKEESLFDFMLQLGNTQEQETDTKTDADKPKASDFGFVDGKLENIEIDAMSAGIASKIYTGTVRIPEGEVMPEDDSLPDVLLMDLPNSYGRNEYTKLTYNETDGTYMPKFKDMAFVLEKDESGKVVLKAVDNEELKSKREETLNLIKDILFPTVTTSGIKTEFILDNYYGDSYQQGQGNCYLMATINAIRNLPDGQKILQDLRKEEIVDGKKVYTISFPGAKLAAKGLENDNLKNGIFITGEYKFTEEEIKRIHSQAGRRYSAGDLDVILIEAAFEKYREEIARTLDANNIHRQNNNIVAGMYTGPYRDNLLRSGHTVDATYILTGDKSIYYSKLAIGEIPALSLSELKNDKAEIYNGPATISKNNSPQKPQNTETGRRVQTKGYSEIDGDIKRLQMEASIMLRELKKDYESDNKMDKIATATFRVANENSSGYHAFTIKRVTTDYVVLINPWDPGKELKMPPETFLRTVAQITIRTKGIPYDLSRLIN